MCSALELCLDRLCERSTRVFVSSQVYDGNLGGIAGANAECAALATAAGSLSPLGSS